MNYLDLARQLADLAKALAPAVIPGAGAAIEAAEKLLALIESAKATFGEDSADVLNEGREALEARVNAHVDRTIAGLRGEG